jgi:serine phosphatase RsbU (regulator of sigma subunit)
VERLLRTRHAWPVGVLVLVVLVDLATGPGQVVLGLAVIAPLVAASTLDRRATATYAVLALVVAVLLGFYDEQYRPDTAVAQAFRLFGVALGGAMALVACTMRLLREDLVARLSSEAATARGAVQLAESLQRSLLTDLPSVPGLQLAARYVPAGRHTRVGGDWYDAFPTADGATMLVIGDVAGHDVAAAATMAQARGMLRGIASTVVSSPAAVLRGLDEALGRLHVDTLVTVTVATVRTGATDGPARLCWSNAGHPPPVLLTGDGRAALLTRPTDLLLGVARDAGRAEHEVSLAPGDTVVLYTDGLVEHRGTDLDDGTRWLVQALTTLAGAPLEELCDTLLADAPGACDDDVAVLAVRRG